MSFWRSEDSANPDTEIVNALRPAMATVPEPLLLGISSPYARRGVLWESYRQHYGQDDDPVLVWNAPTTAMNPTITEAFVAAELEKDEAAARAEYLAEFRVDIESYLSREVIDACVIPGRHELPPVPGLGYRAFCDPAGGSGTDSFSLAVAHVETRDGRRVAVLDAIREARPPFSPEAVVHEFAAGLRSYGIHEVVGDAYAGSWPAEAFRKVGITYMAAAKPKSAIYGDALPSLNAHGVELLDHPRLIAQLCGLERRTSRGGRDSIDHGPHGHDDLVNAVCGVLADLLVHAPGADGGPVPMRGTTIRVDLAPWNQHPGTAAFNSGLFDWSELDAQDRRNRARGS